MRLKEIRLKLYTLQCMQFLINHINIIISCNYVLTFHYKCVLLIFHKP